MSDTNASAYYLPPPSYWPLLGSVSLFLIFIGAAVELNGTSSGRFLAGLGIVLLVYMLIGWFGIVIRESVGGLYNKQVDVSFRWGMAWFIFSEVMFFAAFFGTMFYARVLSVPWLGGFGAGADTHELLWPAFEAVWPTLELPDAANYQQAHGVIGAWGVPLINTCILLSSGLTVTLAHWALKKNQRRALACWLFATVALGLLFVLLQGTEYVHAYQEMNLKLNSGIYGTVFFMLTGFHGLHVTLGCIMLIVIWLRVLRGHFSPQNHFGFEAVAWYWHFVDVVWLLLFFLIYVL